MRYIPLNKLAETLNKDIDQIVRAIKINTFNGVIRDTRVDTGRLRGNWQTTTGQPAKGVVETINNIKQGEDGGSAQDDVIKTIKPDTIDWLTNNLPYAEYWEGRDGMIDKNVARLQRNIQEAIK
jgi:hypothetical protein